MSISLGTPPQSFVAVVDTGSDLTWLQCAPCDSCFSQPFPYFDPSLSSSYYDLSCASTGCGTFAAQYGSAISSCEPSCEYFYSYGDRSNTTGTFAAETINLETTTGSAVTVPGFWFGCSHASTPTTGAWDYAGGLVGLGQGLISFPSQLGYLYGDKFSYCLVSRSSQNVLSSPIVFGEEAISTLPGVQYTPIVPNSARPFYYYVSVEGIRVNGVPANFSADALALDVNGNGGTIIDSGTTYAYFASDVFDALKLTLDAAIPNLTPITTYASLEACYDVTGVDTSTLILPVISFQFANGTNVELSDENSWLSVTNYPTTGSTMICLTITRGSFGEISIFGNTQQRNFHISYDRTNGVLGFVTTDCASS